MPAALADFGTGPEPLLAGFELERAAFTDPEHRMPCRTMAQLLRRRVEATACLHFGLLVGSRAGLSLLGAVDYFASSAPTVGTALEIIRRANSVSDSGGTMTLDCEGGIVSLGYNVVEPGLESTEQPVAVAVATACNVRARFVARNGRRKTSGLRSPPHGLWHPFGRSSA